MSSNTNVITFFVQCVPALDVTKSIRLKKKFNWKALIAQRIPIITWITKYTIGIAIADLIAGMTLGITMIPQALAYSALANLPAQFGLYSAIVGSVIYVFLGTIKEVSIGPTGLMAVLTLQYTMNKPYEYIIVLTFLAGCVELLMGLLKLGFIIDFISIPVMNAFTTVTSLLIIGGQIKFIFGLTYPSNNFILTLYEFGKNITNINLWDTCLGICGIVFLLIFRHVKEIKVNTSAKKGKIISKLLWYLSILANAFIVLITSVVAYNLTTDSETPFQLSGQILADLPTFILPPFEINSNNRTISFMEICQDLGLGIVVIPLVAVLVNVAIAKIFSTGARIDATQEMLTLGVCNLLGSCLQTMPTCGALTRSAVSAASGVKTPMAGLYSAILVILALSLLTPYFYYIPKATLAAVLIVSVLFLIDFKMPQKLWKKNRFDFFAWLGTLIICLSFSVEIGLLFGIAFNILHLLYMWARPIGEIKISELLNGTKYILIVPNNGMFYPGIDYLRAKINNIAQLNGNVVPIVIDCSCFTGMDYTTIQGFIGIANDLSKRHLYLILSQLDENLTNLIKSKNVRFVYNDIDLKECLENIQNFEPKITSISVSFPVNGVKPDL